MIFPPPLERSFPCCSFKKQKKSKKVILSEIIQTKIFIQKNCYLLLSFAILDTYIIETNQGMERLCRFLLFSSVCVHNRIEATNIGPYLDPSTDSLLHSTFSFFLLPSRWLLLSVFIFSSYSDRNVMFG